MPNGSPFSPTYAGTSSVSGGVTTGTSSISQGEFIFAQLSGTVTTIGTYDGSALIAYTSAVTTNMSAGGTTGLNFVETNSISWVFDSICFG